MARNDYRTFGHLTSNFTYGENLHWGKRMKGHVIECEEPVRLWYKENKHYDWENRVNHRGTYSHFTQLIWKSTEKLGCAQVLSLGQKGGTYTVCSYDPWGNLPTPHEHEMNVLSETGSVNHDLTMTFDHPLIDNHTQSTTKNRKAPVLSVRLADTKSKQNINLAKNPKSVDSTINSPKSSLDLKSINQKDNEKVKISKPVNPSNKPISDPSLRSNQPQLSRVHSSDKSMQLMNKPQIATPPTMLEKSNKDQEHTTTIAAKQFIPSSIGPNVKITPELSPLKTKTINSFPKIIKVPQEKVKMEILPKLADQDSGLKTIQNDGTSVNGTPTMYTFIGDDINQFGNKKTQITLPNAPNREQVLQ